MGEARPLAPDFHSVDELREYMAKRVAETTE